MCLDRPLSPIVDSALSMTGFNLIEMRYNLMTSVARYTPSAQHFVVPNVHGIDVVRDMVPYKRAVRYGTVGFHNPRGGRLFRRCWRYTCTLSFH